MVNKEKEKESEYFRPETRLTKYNRKYCSCLVKVRSRQSIYRSNKSNKIKKDVNPYAICSYTLFTRIGKKKPIINCEDNYLWDSLSFEEIQSYAREKNIPIISKRKDKVIETPKSELIRRIRSYLFGKDNSRNKKRESKILKKNIKK